MKILLIKPAFSRLLGNDVYSTFPIGLAYVAGMLKMHGHEVKVYHDDVSNPNPIPHSTASIKDIRVLAPDATVFDPINSVIDSFAPDTVGISYCTADRNAAHGIAAMVRDRGIRTVAGGVHPTLQPMDSLDYFDAVVHGEGDSDFAEDVFHPGFHGVANIPLIQDLDAVLPDRDCIINGNRYSDYLRGMVATQRGCPYLCGFCAAPRVFGTKVRMRDPIKVRQEIEAIGVHCGRVIDDSFAVHKQHGLDVCNELSKIDYTWDCDIALQDIDEEILNALQRAGCNRINIGIESAVERWQKLSGKHIISGRPEEVVRMARDRNISVVFYFMIGYPSETYAEMDCTLEYVAKLKQLGAKPCISVVTPYPNTKIWEMVHGQSTDWDWSRFVHQSSRMGFADATEEEWNIVVSRANSLN